MWRIHLFILAASLAVLEGESFQFSSQGRKSHATRLQMSSGVDSRLQSAADVERQIAGLGRRGNTDRAIELFQSMDAPSLRMLNNAIDACARARPTRLNEAFKLLEEGIEKKRLKPNVFTFGALMSACSRARAGGKAVELLRSMKKQYGVSANAVVYSSAISACSRTEPPRYQTALKLLKEVEDCQIDMSVIGYNAALGACSRAGKWEEAIDLLESMETKGIVDEVSYETVMAACEHGGQWDLVLDYANIMEENGLALDALAISTALHACQQKGLAREALHYLERMKSITSTVTRKTAGWERKGVRAPLRGADNVAYKLAISACARGGRWEDSIRLLSEMKTVFGKADVVAYTAAIPGLASAGQWRKAVGMLDMMQKDGIQPNEVTMTAIMDACATACARGNDGDAQEALKKAFHLLRFMKTDAGVSPNMAVYNALLRACAEDNRLEMAFKVLDDAKGSGLTPNEVSYGTLMTACERAESLQGVNDVFQLMKEAEVIPNEITYGAAISCMRKLSEPDRALLLLQKMIKLDLKPNVALFNTVLLAYVETKRSNLKSAIHVYKLMTTTQSKPNRQTYSMMVKLFCDRRQPQGAEAFLRRMQQQEIKPEVDMYTQTVTAYEKARQPLKALQLMESMEEDGYDFYEIKVLNTAFKNAVKLVNKVGKTLSEEDTNSIEEWEARLRD